jgi:hypothetical protein
MSAFDHEDEARQIFVAELPAMHVQQGPEVIGMDLP